MSRVFRYVVRYDGGIAPRPFDAPLSLAICKPRIRATAEVGDWVIGFRRQSAGEVIYAMQITERLSFAQYWNDPRFAGRKPGQTPFPDNIYRADKGGGLHHVPNHVHGVESRTSDLSGRNVLLSDRFWYFGASSPPLPNELLHLVHSTRGHAVTKNARPGDETLLASWLAAWTPGIHGEPIDIERSRQNAGQWERERASRRRC